MNQDRKRVEDTDKAIGDVFTGIFMHRVQDVDPKIRESTVSYFADLAVDYTEFFFQEKYLQHFITCAEDKDSRVRGAAIRGIAKIYGTLDDGSELDSIETFHDRFCEVVEDLFKDSAAGMTSALLALCAQLDKMDKLPEEFFDAMISEVLLRDGVGVAIQRKAAQMVMQYVDDLNGANKLQQLEAFAEFCAKQTTRGTVGNCDALVAAFFDVVPVLQDAAPIVTKILENSDSESESKQAVLLRILYASAKHARSVYDKDKTAKAKKAKFQNILSTFTLATMGSYDKLVTKFVATDPQFALNILELPQLMVASVFSSKGAAFKRMCQHLQSSYMQLTGGAELRQVAASISALAKACVDTVRCHSLSLCALLI